MADEQAKRILDEDGTEITEEQADLATGYLTDDIVVVAHHEGSPGASEQGHTEYTTFYFTDGTRYDVEGPDDPHVGPDGWAPQEGEDDKVVFGADQKWVIDVPQVAPKGPWDETEDILRYIKYTDEQLASMASAKKASARAAAVQAFAVMMAASLPDEQAAMVPDLYDDWSGDGVAYAEGDRVVYGGALYRCLAPGHISQPAWNPIDAASLWGKVLAENVDEAVEWVRPGSTNGYPYGQLVTHGGKTWRSTCNGNVWEPGALNAPWVEVA